MLRTYRKLKNETIKVGKLAQVVNDKITTRFPLLKKGIDLKPTIPNTYQAGRSTLSNINENKIITAVDNVLYLSEYKDGIFTEISKTTLLETIIVQKIINLNKSKLIVIYNDRATIGCYLIDVSLNTNSITVIERFTISSTNAGNPRIDAELINNNKLAIAYHEEINAFKSYPCFVVVRIENNSFKMLQNPIKIEEQIDMTSVLGITKINSNTFLASYATTSMSRNITAHSVIYEVSSTDLLTQISTLEYKGYYDMGDYYIKPFYLADNKLLIFEFENNFDFNIVLRQANKEISTGTFTFNSIATLKANAHTVHNFDLLRQNEDDSRDFVAFNSQIIRVDKNNAKLTEVDRFATFTRSSLGVEFKKIPTTRLSNNLIVYTDTENNLKTYSYLDNDGQVLGIVKGGNEDSYSVSLSGLVEDISTNFKAGKKVYYDSMGNLSHDNLQNYLGYAVSKNSFILRPELNNLKTIVEGSEGYLNNGKNYLHGFIPYIDETIENGKPYYLDNLNNLTTTLTDRKIGIGLGKGLYVKREKAPTQAEIDAKDLAIVQSILDKINLTGGEIEENIELQTLSTEGVSLTYASSNPLYLSNDGVVTKPSFSVGNQAVILTASITKGNVSATKDFAFTVLAEVPLGDNYTIKIIGEEKIVFTTTETYTAIVKNNGIEDVSQTVTFSLENIIRATPVISSVDGNQVDITNKTTSAGTFVLKCVLDSDSNVFSERRLKINW